MLGLLEDHAALEQDEGGDGGGLPDVREGLEAPAVLQVQFQEDPFLSAATTTRTARLVASDAPWLYATAALSEGLPDGGGGC